MQFSRSDLAEIVCKSSTIDERLGSGFIPCRQEHCDLIDSRLAEWCDLVADGDWDKFQRRLSWGDLDFEALRSILGSVSLADEQDIPGWAHTLNDCMHAASLFSPEALENRAREINSLFPKVPLPFEELFLPFINLAKQKLATRVTPYCHLLSERAHTNLEVTLLYRLTHLCAPTLELEFSIFRACSQSVLARRFGEHSGFTSNYLYRQFIERLLTAGLLSFFKKYPVLARSTAKIVDLWVDATSSFIARLAADWPEIQTTFSDGTKLNQAINIQDGCSDFHCGGNSVILIEFDSGLKLVYKPKDLSLEHTYFKLIFWLNDHDITLPFKSLTIINRKTYGWVEFAEYLPCNDEQEVKRYYFRAGMLLCLVYALEATDLHVGNLIPSGEHPVLIDMETLLHHYIDESKVRGTPTFAIKHTLSSVLRTGLLPRWNFGPTGRGFDTSGLGGLSAQQTHKKIIRWDGINTDDMALRSEFVKTQLPDSAELFPNIDLSLNDHAEDIVDGFRRMYRFMLEHRHVMQSPDGPLAEFAHQRVRFVFRNTATYNTLLQKISHPKFLTDGADQSIQLDVLSRGFLSSDTKTIFWPLLAIEKQALEQRDIPLFSAYTDSNDLEIDSSQVIERCFSLPSYDSVISHLNKFSKDDLEQQVGLIRGSIYTRVIDDIHHAASPTGYSAEAGPNTALTREVIVQTALEIAVRIQKTAINIGDGGVTWLAPQYVLEARRFQILPMRFDLFDGACGVALFLAALERVTGGVGFHDLALAALRPLRQELQDATPKHDAMRNYIGGAIGCGSIIYSLVHLSQLLEDPTLLEDARKVASLITPNIISSDQSFDVMFGSAGAILGLIALQQAAPSHDVWGQAITCGYHLLNNRVTSDSGYRVWRTFNGRLLSGFSHGSAGIAYALLRLYATTGEVAFLDAFREAVNFERAALASEVGSQTGSSPLQISAGFTNRCSWCHGAPGIGLARVAALNILDDEQIRQDIEVYLDVTRQRVIAEIDHLCCGNLGRAEFLLTAASKFSDCNMAKSAEELVSHVIARARRNGDFMYGSILSDNPGFFQGSAGIGYEILRLFHTNSLPSVLLWE